MLKEKIFQKLGAKQPKDFIIYGFGQAINLISPLLVIPYIVSICGEEGLGKAGVGFSFALIAIVLVDYGDSCRDKIASVFDFVLPESLIDSDY